ncbi:MAG TPA: MFS transporter, partial [Roseiflexaceae bacterium]|nr:MFS transporter [Roseiflexaceae bacterium]
MLATLPTSLLGFLDIRRGEGRGVALVLLYGILLFSANVLVHTAGYALFLAEFGAGSLPYTYLGVAAVAPVLSLVTMRLNERFALGPVLLGIHTLLLVAMAGVWAGLLAAPPWLIFSLPVFFGVISTLMYASYWSLLGRLYTLQQGKRLFGLLGSGENLATIVLGFATPPLVSSVGTANMFLAAAVVMAPTLAVLASLLRANAAAFAEPTGERSERVQRAPLGPLLRDRYLKLIIAVFALLIVGIYIVDNLFYTQAERMFPNEDTLAGFLGRFFGVYGALSLAIQLFVSGRVLSRFGVQPILLATPAGLLAITALFALSGTLGAPLVALFWTAAVAELYRLVMDAVDVAASNVLYQPLPERQRTQAQTLVDGIIYPLAIGLAGLVLLLLTGVLRLEPVQLAYAVLPIFVTWLALAAALGQAYPMQLRAALSGRRLGGATLTRPDRSTLDALQQGLASPQLGVVLYTLDLLADHAPETLADQLPALISHPEREVRLATLRWVERLGLTAAIPLIRDRLAAEGSRPVQAASLRALAALGDQAGFDVVAPYLEHPEPALRHGAVVGLLRSGELEGILLAGERLLGWVRSRRPEERELAAQALGEGGIAGFYRPLLALIGDERPDVQRAALAAAGKLQHPKLWPPVAACLASPQVRAAAVAALAAGGDAAMLTVERAFDQPGQRRDVAARLARVCGKIGGERAVSLLRRHLDWPDVLVRSEVLAALARCDHRADAAERARAHEALRAEAEHAAWTLASLR